MGEPGDMVPASPQPRAEQRVPDHSQTVRTYQLSTRQVLAELGIEVPPVRSHSPAPKIRVSVSEDGLGMTVVITETRTGS